MVLVRPEDRKIEDHSDVSGTTVHMKTPKRILEFCDGILEEYSTDEEDDAPEEHVDVSTLNWTSWMWYKTWSVGSITLSFIDSVGEFFANVFGITTPRYYFELEEHNRRESLRLKQEDEERGWSQPSASSAHLSLTNEISKLPKPVEV